MPSSVAKIVHTRACSLYPLPPELQLVSIVWAQLVGPLHRDENLKSNFQHCTDLVCASGGSRPGLGHATVSVPLISRPHVWLQIRRDHLGSGDITSV
jgi:hypothetical protein